MDKKQILDKYFKGNYFSINSREFEEGYGNVVSLYNAISIVEEVQKELSNLQTQNSKLQEELTKTKEHYHTDLEILAKLQGEVEEFKKWNDKLTDDINKANKPTQDKLDRIYDEWKAENDKLQQQLTEAKKELQCYAEGAGRGIAATQKELARKEMEVTALNKEVEELEAEQPMSEEEIYNSIMTSYDKLHISEELNQWAKRSAKALSGRVVKGYCRCKFFTGSYEVCKNCEKQLKKE